MRYETTSSTPPAREDKDEYSPVAQDRNDEVPEAPPSVATDAPGIDTEGASIQSSSRTRLEVDDQLLEYISEAGEGLHLLSELRGRYGEDAFFVDILANPTRYKNFYTENELVYLRDGGRKLLCVPSILKASRNVREIVISHAHSLLAHLGAHKKIGRAHV